MNKTINTISIVLFLNAFIGLASAQQLDSATISSGGAVDLSGNGYTVHDLKGQAAAGSVTDGTTMVETGGIYTEGGDEVVIDKDVPYGTVPLLITRTDQDHIRISWNKTTYSNPQIFFLVGDGTGSFTNTYSATTWLPAAGNPAFEPHLTDGYVLHLQQVGKGEKEAYYKGLQSSVTPATKDPANGTLCIENAWAVGKVNVDLYGGGRGFVSAPFMSNSFNDVFGANFTNNDQIWYWDNSQGKFTATYTFSGGSWPAVNANLAQGYWFDIIGTAPGSKKIVTIIGSLSNAPVSTQISTGWDMIGNPFPRQITNSGLVSGIAANDQIWIWDNDQHKFTGTMSYAGANWTPAAQLLPGLGYRYNHLGGGFKWTVSN
jgi:hypothetical protein